MKNFWFLLVLLLIVIITVSLSSYKIETFMSGANTYNDDYYDENAWRSDENYGRRSSATKQNQTPVQMTDAPTFDANSYQTTPSRTYYPVRSTNKPYEDITTPQTPNDMTCYNYIKNIKGWNVDELSKDQMKVLLTMRALQGGQYTDDSRTYPYGDGCVIPKEHLPIFNKNESDLTPLTVTPSATSNKNTCSNPNDNNPDRKPVNSKVTLYATAPAEYPAGLKADFKTMDFEKFKDFLQGAYPLYDQEFLVEKQKLQDELIRQTKIRDWWAAYRQSLENATNEFNNKRNNLLRYDSTCQTTKRGNENIHMPEWNNKLTQMNDNISLINRLWGYLWDGWMQIWNMWYC